MHKYVQIEVFSAGVAYQPEIIPYISFVSYYMYLIQHTIRLQR